MSAGSSGKIDSSLGVKSCRCPRASGWRDAVVVVLHHHLPVPGIVGGRFRSRLLGDVEVVVGERGRDRLPPRRQGGGLYVKDEAISLLSVGVNFGVTQVVNGNNGVHAVILKALFKKRSSGPSPL